MASFVLFVRIHVTSNAKVNRSRSNNQIMRHRRGLPVRGQRTKTNARTRKGPIKAIKQAK